MRQGGPPAACHLLRRRQAAAGNHFLVGRRDSPSASLRTRHVSLVRALALETAYADSRAPDGPALWSGPPLRALRKPKSKDQIRDLPCITTLRLIRVVASTVQSSLSAFRLFPRYRRRVPVAALQRGRRHRRLCQSLGQPKALFNCIVICQSRTSALLISICTFLSDFIISPIAKCRRAAIYQECSPRGTRQDRGGDSQTVPGLLPFGTQEMSR